MRYALDFSTKNGLGKPALSIFLSGCDRPNKCENCHNPELWEPSQESYENLILDLEQACNIFQRLYRTVRVAIIGGEPLASYNKLLTYTIAKYVKDNYMNSEVILYSWRSLELIHANDTIKNLLDYIDYGVLGAYDKNLHEDNTIPASSNQYIYDFKRSIRLPSIKLKE